MKQLCAQPTTTVELTSLVTRHPKPLSLIKILFLLALAGAVLLGCGGSTKPTKVTAADLNRDGDFWKSLSPDLKDELMDLARRRLDREAPAPSANDYGSTNRAGQVLRAIERETFTAEVDKQYTNEAKRRNTIFETWRQVASELVSRRLFR